MVEEPLSYIDPQDSGTTKLLDRLSDILLANDTRGYLIRLGTEPLPLFVIWSLGDLLGFLTGWKDFRLGARFKGRLKMLTAIIPGVPTIPLHFIIDKISGETRTARSRSLVKSG
jgi:hypothetical protein